MTSEDLYNKIKDLIKKVPNYEKIEAIGIGVPGSVDKKINKMVTSTNLSILKDFPLIQRVKQDFNKPVFLENDARVAALAEAIKGKGMDKNIVCYVTISTGLGGGIVIDKKIYHGSNNLGAYFARMIIDGENTCNSLISGTALLKQAQDRIDDSIKNTVEIFELSKKENIVAKEIIEKFKKNLKVFLLNIASIINPDIIILGGGVIKSKDDFLKDVIDSFKAEVHPLARDTIIDSTILNEPGIIGAALLAKKYLVEK